MKPFRRRCSLVGEISQELLTRIQRMNSRGQEELPAERALAQEMGVSRPVMREALKWLQSQGLVEVQHGVGNRVVNRLHKPVGVAMSLQVPDPRARLRQLMEARLILEPEMARLAAGRINLRQRNRLRHLQTKLGVCNAAQEAIEYDVEFHRVLAEASGNDVLLLMMRSVAELQKESRAITLAHSGIALVCTHHEQILKAVERGDADAAAQAMRHHLETAAQDLARQLSSMSTKKVIR